MGLDLEFLHGVDYGKNRVAAAKEELIDDSIQKKQIASVPLAIDRRDDERGTRQCQRRVKTGASTVALCRVYGCGSRRQHKQLCEIAPIERQFLNGLLCDYRSQLGSGLLQQ